MRRHSILHSTGHGISSNLLYHNLSLDIIHRIPSVLCSVLGNLIWVLGIQSHYTTPYTCSWQQLELCGRCIMLLVIATGAAVYLVLVLGCAIVYRRYTIVYSVYYTLTDTLARYRKYIRRWYSRYWQISTETSWCLNGFCVSTWKVSSVNFPGACFPIIPSIHCL